MRVHLAAGALAGLLGLAGPAAAALVDFTDPDAHTFSPDVVSGTVAGVGFEARPGDLLSVFLGPPRLTQNAGAVAGTPLAGETDGLGVRDDEVGGFEFITVTFDRAVRVTEVHFLDLFRHAGGHDAERAVLYGDAAQVLDVFEADQAQGAGLPGYLGADIDHVGTTFSFGVGLGNDGMGVGDYALAGIGVTPVPLPASALLLGAALGGLGLARRRA